MLIGSQNMEWNLLLWKRLTIFGFAYGFREGFRVRIRFTNKNKDGSVSSCRFDRCKEGLWKKGEKYAYEGKNPESRV